MDLAARTRSARANDPLLETLDHEARQEAASALRRAGRKLEEAVASLERQDATLGTNSNRDELIHEIADQA